MSAAAKTTNPNFRNTSEDYLKGLELELKEIWSQYVACLDKYGFTETAKSLRERYFNVYRSYKQNKEWRKIMSNNNFGETL